MLAVHFGAGNIGRGFIGKLLFHSNYQTVFIDVNEEIVNLINKKQEYRVVLADKSAEVFTIRDITAINSQKHPEQVVEILTKADLVTTAVGPNILPFIADLLAEGLKRRLKQSKQRLNIIACENMIGGSSFLKERVYERLSEYEKEQFDLQFAFPNAAVDRIVPNQHHDDPLMVKVEPFYEWVVDESEIVGEIPKIEGITYVNDLKPFIERKLFTVNTGHALSAYFGYYYGFQTVDEAMKNQKVKSFVEGALNETGSLLISKYQFDPAVHQEYIDKILMRFSNSNITDEVTRVARSPIRKLGPEDRLVSPAKQYVDVFSKNPNFLIKGIAAALVYEYNTDPESLKIQAMIDEVGIENVVKTITGLDPHSLLFKGIVEQYQQLKSERNILQA